MIAAHGAKQRDRLPVMPVEIVAEGDPEGRIDEDQLSGSEPSP